MKDKKLLKQLRTLAASLPQTFYTENHSMSGAEIIAQKPDAKDENGNSLDPNRMYSTSVNKPFTHYRMLKRIYQSEGIAGANKYVANVIAAYKDSYESHVKAQSNILSIEERKSSVIPFGL